MALKRREITTDFFMQEGVVATDFAAQKTENDFAAKAQKNMIDDKLKAAVYTPLIDEDYQKRQNREISYSYALANIYFSLNKLDKAVQLRPSDDEETAKTKNDEKAIISMLAKKLEKVYPSVLKQEYPDAVPLIENGAIKTKLYTNPKPAVFDGALKESMEELTRHGLLFVKAVQNASPHFQSKTMSYLNNFLLNVNDKMNGKTVLTQEKSDEELMDDVKASIQRLIFDDSNSDNDWKVDRERAAKDLAKKLAPLGMELVVCQQKERTPEEEQLTQAKTCVLRAAWDGFIERPKQTSCSPVLRDVLNHPRPENNTPEKYNLNESPVWNICKEVPDFADIKFDLQKALSQRNFPLNKIKDLSYVDIAYLITTQRLPNSQDVEKRQKEGKKEVDGVRLNSSGRTKFFKKFAHEHGKDLQVLLESQGMSSKEIKTIIEQMRAGKSNDVFDGHHNYPISNPDIFEKITGKHWTRMNEDVALMDKSSHKLIHMIENNVNAKGEIIDQDGTSSHRTIFIDEKSGNKYYYFIRLKEGIEGLTGIRHQSIYNRSYLSDRSFENSDHLSVSPMVLQNKTARNTENDTCKKQAEHTRDRISSLNRRKNGTENETQNTPKDKTPVRQNKQSSMSRPNYQGRRQFGGNRIDRPYC